MNHTWYVVYIWIIVIVLLYFPLKKRRRAAANRVIAKKRIGKQEENKIVKEFAQRFIGKDVYIKLLEGTADGFIKEVTDGGIILESNGNLQIVNLDYVMKIREYPYKKGKRATIWGE